MRASLVTLCLFLYSGRASSLQIDSQAQQNYWKTGTPHGMYNEVASVPKREKDKYIRIAVAGDSIADDTMNPF